MQRRSVKACLVPSSAPHCPLLVPSCPGWAPLCAGQGLKHSHWDKVLPHLDYALFCIKSPIPGARCAPVAGSRGSDVRPALYR